MADRVKGITIELDGDTTKLSSALKSVNSDIKDTQSQLKDVEKLLKLDPKNVELLRQKTVLLEKAVESTKEKLDTLKKAQAQMDAKGVDKTSQEYMALQREIAATEQELKKLEEASDNSCEALQKIGDVASSVSKGANKVADATKAISTAAAALLTSLAAAGYKAVTTADDLNTLAKQSGFTTEELQKISYASDLIDVSLDSVTEAARQMKTKMTSTSTEVTKAWTTLGVSVTDSAGKLRDTNEVFWEVVEALGSVENGSERDALAMQIFGESADKLAGIIDDGGAALEAYGEDAEAVGAIMSQDVLDSLNAVNDQLDQLKANASATLAVSGAKAIEALTPVIDEVVEGLNNLLTAIGNMSEGELKAIVNTTALVAAIAPVAKGISGIASAVSKAIPIITKLIPAIKAAAVALSGSMAGAIGIAVAAVAALIAGMMKLCQYMEDEAQSAYAEAAEEAMSYAEAVAYIQENQEEYMRLTEAMKEIELQQMDTVGMTAEEYNALTEEYLRLQQELIEIQPLWEVATQVLANHGETVESVTSATEEDTGAIEENTDAIEENAEATEEAVDNYEALAEAYDKAYSSAKTSIEGQIKLFERWKKELDEEGDTATELYGTMQENTEALANYTENLRLAAEYGIDEGLIASLSDGSAESAAQIDLIIKSLQEGEDGLTEFGKTSEETVDMWNKAWEDRESAVDALAEECAAIELMMDEEKGEMYRRAYLMGCNFTDGLIKGIEDGTIDIGKAASEAMTTAIESANRTAEIASPSRVMAESGKWFDLGLAEGIRSYSGEVADAATQMTAQATTAASNTASNTVNNINNSTTYGGISISAVSLDESTIDYLFSQFNRRMGASLTI